MLVSYDVDVLRSGMKVGRDVLDMDGKIVLKKNTTLNADLIQNLLGHNIFSVYIEEEEEESALSDDHLLDTDYLEQYKKTLDKLQGLYYKVSTGLELDTRDLDFILEAENIAKLCDPPRCQRRDFGGDCREVGKF